jgi:putative SOS response-associated peptidase YedK
MCATFRIDFEEDADTLREIARRIEEKYGVDRMAELARTDLFPRSEAPIVSKDGIGMLQWGFPLPGNSSSRVVFNARSETILEKPMFRASASRRCAVPATSFYEWDHRSGKALRMRIRLESDPFFYMACLWNRFRKEDGTTLNAFVLLTTTPNGLISPFHDRMPCILAPEDLQAWIGDTVEPAEALGRLGPFQGALRLEAA